ncbi:MAG: hypothetical protein HZA04_07910 [Nitrospinae bacterium]|nr:hypothetical protein [Nitrospinota bacterium]
MATLFWSFPAQSSPFKDANYAPEVFCDFGARAIGCVLESRQRPHNNIG